MFGTDGEQQDRVLRLTSSGGAIINDVVFHLTNAELPFGGVGESGMGSYRKWRQTSRNISFDAGTNIIQQMGNERLITLRIENQF